MPENQKIQISKKSRFEHYIPLPPIIVPHFADFMAKSPNAKPVPEVIDLASYCIIIRLNNQLFTLKKIIMGNLLYTVAVILIIIWAIGFFGYHAGGIIHVLLVIAVIAILLKVIRNA
jgi:predicted ferric reductase